jgi:hypothetical protein
VTIADIELRLDGVVGVLEVQVGFETRSVEFQVNGALREKPYEDVNASANGEVFAKEGNFRVSAIDKFLNGFRA